MTITNSAATITVDKKVDADGDDAFSDTESIDEPGGTVTYRVVITNTSAEDTVTLDSLTDAIEGGAATETPARSPAWTPTTTRRRSRSCSHPVTWSPAPTTRPWPATSAMTRSTTS